MVGSKEKNTSLLGKESFCGELTELLLLVEQVNP